MIAPDAEPIGHTPPETLESRFESRTIPEPNSGCLLWMGTATPNGYGYIREKGRKTRTSHVAMRIAGKEVPQGAYVLHRCDNPHCVNVDHLFIGSPKANMADMIAKGRQDFSGLRLPSVRRLSDEKHRIARAMFDEGYGPLAAAQKAGVNKNTIGGWFRKWRAGN